eukprot:TRINITY_DN3088_c0_g1_i4.p1 TRINITY_DN3088_c0_g1~~TRINITY_DN3088_c0_g1_i4.p1  ORF type:complete len:351 (-),score=-0.62 TRINITY_DN3088_c0_g1_i4:260-1312(-)
MAGVATQLMTSVTTGMSPITPHGQRMRQGAPTALRPSPRGARQFRSHRVSVRRPISIRAEMPAPSAPDACEQREEPLLTSAARNVSVTFPSNGSYSSLTAAVTALTNDVATGGPQQMELTGGSLGFAGATEPLVRRSLGLQKRIVLLRHGLSAWNAEGRVQGSSDASLLSEVGEIQALRCKQALRDTHFDCCYASPISRAKLTAEIIWEGRKEPLVFMDSLKEANLHFLEGMLNSEAKARYPDLFRAWREDPSNFCVDGVYPVRGLWKQAANTWRELLESPGSQVLVVTHKSLLRALICTALGLGPEKFRSMDINNGGLCVVMVNRNGEPMVESLNLTAHLQSQAISYHF